MSYEVKFSDYAYTEYQKDKRVEYLRTHITVKRKNEKEITVGIYGSSFCGAVYNCPPEHWEKIKEIVDGLIEKAKR